MTEEKRQPTRAEMEAGLVCGRGCRKGSVVVIVIGSGRGVIECSSCQWATPVLTMDAARDVWMKENQDGR